MRRHLRKIVGLLCALAVGLAMTALASAQEADPSDKRDTAFLRQVLEGIDGPRPQGVFVHAKESFCCLLGGTFENNAFLYEAASAAPGGLCRRRYVFAKQAMGTRQFFQRAGDRLELVEQTVVRYRTASEGYEYQRAPVGWSSLLACAALDWRSGWFEGEPDAGATARNVALVMGFVAAAGANETSYLGYPLAKLTSPGNIDSRRGTAWLLEEWSGHGDFVKLPPGETGLRAVLSRACETPAPDCIAVKAEFDWRMFDTSLDFEIVREGLSGWRITQATAIGGHYII